MKPFFVDTGAWYALMNREDARHGDASHFLAALSGPLLTTNYIAVETINLLNARVGHSAALRFMVEVHSSRILTMHHIGAREHEEAQLYFKKHADEEWSLTDCSSFVIMNALGLHEAFTFDKHFSQAGFSRVP